MIEVFLRTCPKSDIRRHIAHAVIDRWDMFENVELHIITGSRSDFHWWSRIEAEESSTADYIFADDDVMPIEADFVDRLREQWSTVHWSVAMLGVTSAICRETGIGGISLIRRRTIPFREFSGPANTDDIVIAGWMEKHLLRKEVSPLLVNHFGFGLSESSPNLWLKC